MSFMAVMFAVNVATETLGAIGTINSNKKQKKLNKKFKEIKEMEVDIGTQKAITEQMKRFSEYSKDLERVSGTKKVALAYTGVDKRSSVFQGTKIDEMEDYYGTAQDVVENVRKLEENAVREKNLLDYAIKIENAKLKDQSNGALINGALNIGNAYAKKDAYDKVEQSKFGYNGGSQEPITSSSALGAVGAIERRK